MLIDAGRIAKPPSDCPCLPQACSYNIFQFSPGDWYMNISETTLADTLLDGIVHESDVIEIRGGEAEKSMPAVYGFHGIKSPCE